MAIDNIVAAKWQKQLRLGGYEAPQITRWRILRYRFLSRMWRQILSAAGLKRSSCLKVLEFGCGGGAQIMPLFVNGWDVTGIDCSWEVILRAREHVRRVRAACVTKGKIKLLHEDFMRHKPPRAAYDMTVAFGVLEHFLNSNERIRYLKKMFEYTKPGGIMVSAVPNGRHPYRKEQKKYGYGGYIIPEIDYSPRQLEKEMRKCGARNVIVICNNLLGYLRVLPGNIVVSCIRDMVWLVAQLPIFRLLPRQYREKKSYWLIVIGRKSA